MKIRRIAMIVVALAFLLVASSAVNAADYHIKVVNGLGSNLYEDKGIDILYKATKDDTVFIHLMSPGGTVIYGIGYLNAIKMSKAKIVTINEGAAYSLAAMILMHGDEIVIGDYSRTLFHLANRNGVVVELSNPTQILVARMLDEKVAHILTDEEQWDLVRGKDIILSAEQMRNRLKYPVNKQGSLITKYKIAALAEQQGSIVHKILKETVKRIFE